MKQSFIEGAVIVSAGGIAAKILGAFYRIPLTNLLGGQGMGVYQMVYPLYCLLLTLASAGVPAGLSRIVSVWQARGIPSRGVLSRALLLFGAVGGAGSLLMLAAAGGVSALQGEPAAAEAYRMLAPSVFLVALISCFRGWFQGRHNFLPTALSETAEQAVKAALGLSFAYVFRADVYRAVSYALLSVTASELFALLLLVALSLPAKKPLYAPASPPAKSVFRVTLPVAAAAGVLPLSHFADSVLIVRLLARAGIDATAQYGLFAGAASTLVNLPASVCYGLAAAVVPAVSAARAQGGSGGREIAFALKCTLFLSLPAAAFLLAFPGQTCAFLFRSVAGEEGRLLAGLVRALSPSAVLLAAAQTLSACLTGCGRPRAAACSMAAGVAVKLALEAALLSVPAVGIFGAAYAADACYLVALLLNLYYSIKGSRLRAGQSGLAGKIGAAGRVGSHTETRSLQAEAGGPPIWADALRFLLFSALAVGAAWAPAEVHVLWGLAAAGGVYLALSWLFRAFSAEELSFIARKKFRKRRTG